MKESSAEPAPTITAQILPSRETHHIEVLPDWGAHIRIGSRERNVENPWSTHRQPPPIQYQSQGSE